MLNPLVVSDVTSIKEILRRFISNIALQTSSEIVRFSDEQELVPGQIFDIRAFYRPHYTGIRLEAREPWSILIEFMFGTRRNGRLVIDGDQIWLGHTGRVHRSKERPISEKRIVIDHEEVHLVANLVHTGIRDEIIRFHQSRLDVGSDEATSTAISTGPMMGGVRAEALFSAHHSPVVASLKDLLSEFGWQPAERQGESDPDLVVTRDGRIVLFEIKPSCKTHEVICGIGQCLAYGTEYAPDRKIVILLSSDFAFEAIRPWLCEALRKLDVQAVRASADDGEFTFHFDPDDELIRGKVKP